MPKEDDHIRHTVSVKSDLNERMTARIEEGGFSSVSEYVRHAIREDLSRAERENLDQVLIQGLGDERYSELGPEYLDSLRERVRKARDASAGNG